MSTPPRQELTPMQAAVEAVRRGASYGAAAREHGVSESGCRNACRRAGVRSIRAKSGGQARRAARADHDQRQERVTVATKRFLSGETHESTAALLKVHPSTVAEYVSDGLRQRAEWVEADLRSMRLELMQRHMALAARFGQEAVAALNEGERGDAARCASVVQRSLDSLAKMTGADAPQQVQVEHSGGPDIMAILREAATHAPRVLSVENGQTLGMPEPDAD